MPAGRRDALPLTLSRSAFHFSNAAACAWHRSLPGAGRTVHRSQIGLSQVPLFRFGTFQSHSSVARRPQAHFGRRTPQIIPVAPFGMVTRSQATEFPFYRR